MSKSNTILSKLAVAVGVFDQGVKQFLFNLFQIDTVAAAGTTQATGTVLLANKNVVTGATGANGVVLPAAIDGAFVDIMNDSASSLLVYPSGSVDVINALAASTAFSQAPNTKVVYYCSGNGQWYASAAAAMGATVNTNLLTLSGIETGLTAHAGGGQASALALSATKSVHEVTTVATAADSVALPAATGSGVFHFVKNSAAANSMQVFAVTPSTIDGVATGTGVAVAAGKSRVFVDADSGNWISIAGA
ncbi:MAG: hypothetical protein ACYDBH_00545 [Acidobacteriaceae bacterium]